MISLAMARAASCGAIPQRAVETWLMTSGQVRGTGVGTASTAWQVLGTGDFDGDDTSDVLWRNTNTGEVDTRRSPTDIWWAAPA